VPNNVQNAANLKTAVFFFSNMVLPFYPESCGQKFPAKTSQRSVDLRCGILQNINQSFT
jgi:hypothetical protein